MPTARNCVTNSSSKLRRTLVAPPNPPTMMRLNEAERYPGLRHSLTTGVVAEQPVKPRVNPQTTVIGKNERFTSHFPPPRHRLLICFLTERFTCCAPCRC